MLVDSCPRQEVANAPLGDARRIRRYVMIIDAFVRRPDASVPEAMGDEARLEGYYRMMRNEAIDHFKLLEAHFDGARRRSEAVKAVLVVHDTTELAFEIDDEPAREHLARLSANRQGFEWHASLAVSADGLRAPLGLVASRPFVHDSQLEDEEARAFWQAIDGVMDNEQRRWIEAVEAAEARLEQVDSVIHVMDQEADDYLTLFAMQASGYSFVVRISADRNVCDGPRRTDFKELTDALAEVEWVADARAVDLSARPKRKGSKGHPVRRARTARLKARAARVAFRRPDHILAPHAPARLEVNVVEVLEVGPPDKEEPVRWLLVTDQPIDTAEEIWQIVDWYRARWVIEEFFKSLKTGAAYLKLQHKRAATLLAALAAKAVVAWHLLVLRHIGRNLGEADARAVVNDVQLALLRSLKPKHFGRKPTAADALAAVAELGGHIRRNGPPGWLVLGRGWKHLRELEKGYRLGLQGREEM